MGIAVASGAQYKNSIRKLFPQGDYWDEQFADPESDTSLFVEAKTAELIRLRERMGTLLDESKPESTTELIADWERILLGDTFSNLGIEQRRLQLNSLDNPSLNRAVLQKTAEMFGLNIQSVTIPYRPRCFGFAKFGQERIGSFLTFFVLKIVVVEANVGIQVKNRFEEAVKNKLLANHIPFFYYGGE